MTWSLAISVVATLLLGFAAQKLGIFVAHKWGLVDIPTSRRRHQKPMPIIGGVVLFFAWSLGVGIFSLLQPAWFALYQTSVVVLTGAVFMLVTLGVVDDLKGVGPYSKLFWQFAAVVLVMIFEPRTHALCLYWQDKIGIIIWPLVTLWIVGMSNAINLVDGLDGLAGGTAFLVSSSLVILSASWGVHGEFILVIMALLLPAIASFLFFNWHPARVFMGDNGSLPLGFLVGTVSLMCPPSKNTWIHVASILVMMGYPIMDMGLCVLRRYRKKNPLFKADRNHLHYRILRLGLSVPQTTILLWGLSFCLQLTALCVDLMSSAIGFLVISVVGFSLTCLLYLIRAIENWHVTRISHAAHKDPIAEAQPQFKECVVAHIELDPLFEAGMFEEKERVQQVVASLNLMLQRMIRGDDFMFFSGNKLSLVFTKYDSKTDRNYETLRRSLKERLSLFQQVFELQYSLASLPIKFEKQGFLLVKNGTPTPVVANTELHYETDVA